jgi:hypothetical protein
MRFHFNGSLAKLFVLTILLSAVACSELPELEKLVDNSSNDFTPASYAVGEITKAVAAQLRPTVSAAAPRLASSQNPSSALFIGPFLSSRNLLELYSVLRT